MRVKSLADGKITLWGLTTEPANLKNLKATDLASATKLSCSIMKSDYALGPTGSSTVNEVEMCVLGEGNAFGPSAASGSLTVFWYLNEDGTMTAADNAVWDLLKAKGTELILVEREGVVESTAAAAKQLVSIYRVTTDSPQPPSDRFSGYSKRTIPLAVQIVALNVELAA